MRFDTAVQFYSDSAKHYDPKTSTMVGGSKLVADVLANVTDMGTTRRFELFGSLATNVKTIRLVNAVGQSWSYCMIDGQKYVLQTQVDPLKSHSLIVGENHG